MTPVAFEDRPPDRADLARALELAPRYDKPGPRYTSYPPAPHFVDTVDGETARTLYRARTRTSPPLSLYAHLPFCESLCTYCGCNVIISRNHAIVERYLAGLEKEMTLAADALSGGRKDVVQFHLGGGTPTYFSPDELERLHGLVTARFSLLPEAEQALEADPRVTTKAHLATLARLGFRRLSMGIQDFDPQVQEAVHRVQSVDLTAALVADARALGFSSVNVDLMYGLPFQTLEKFKRTLELVLTRLSPDRVALFGYAHVPWLKSHQRKIDEATLPRAQERLALFQAGVEAFVGAGYEFVGFDHFAKPTDEMAVARRTGDLHRNFMGFHTSAGSDMVAFGITGIGDVAGTYLQNRHTLAAWERDLSEGRLPVQCGYARTEDDRVRGAIIQELTCNGRVPVALLEAAGTPWRQTWAPELARLAPAVEDGILVVGDEGLRLTPLGRLFVRNVCMAFDAHLGKAPARAKKPDAPRYSRTV
ncbi:MAG: oxygen-independent coproporphyrinogen III oxidase [Planctomycetes bacterium]|nr:oxygen-independent coproporphyrinogen III oxidase [Planctomycetota bacterium]